MRSAARVVDRSCVTTSGTQIGAKSPMQIPAARYFIWFRFNCRRSFGILDGSRNCGPCDCETAETCNDANVQPGKRGNVKSFNQEMVETWNGETEKSFNRETVKLGLIEVRRLEVPR